VNVVTEDRRELLSSLVRHLVGMAIAKRLAEDGFIIAFHSKSSVMIGQALAKAYLGASYSQADLADQN